MPLTDTQIRNARYNPDPEGNNSLSDGGRMYLKLTRAGGKLWRMNYRFAGKDKTLIRTVGNGTSARFLALGVQGLGIGTIPLSRRLVFLLLLAFCRVIHSLT